MSDKVAEIAIKMGSDDMSAVVVNLWETWNNQRAPWLAEKKELMDYIHATDTSTTSNSTLPWKNSTTIPKMTQIRDNIHTNYMAALFPNDKWLSWQGYDDKAASKDTARTITAYMTNKCREGNYENIVDQLALDYIDFGNAFVTADYERRYNTTETGETIPGFIGPKSVRINPLDIVFNPLAVDFRHTPKIIRSHMTLGEIKKLSMTNPEQYWWKEVLDRRMRIRQIMNTYSVDDFNKANRYTADGFGNMAEYYKSDLVEVLEFFGDYHDSNVEGDDALMIGRIITVVDRSQVVRNDKIDTYDGQDYIRHVGWRKRNNNLWAMGPLDNLVGMQYRLDHLENAKADAWDLAIHPPLGIIGDVETFIWGPGQEIHFDEGGDVKEILKNLGAIINADNEMEYIMSLMELMAGAPREAMGVRSPGEKTAFEVQTLDNAAGRVFQQKIKNFERNLMEPNLNDMFELAHKNMEGTEVIRIIDDDIGVVEFNKITKSDITSKGVLRPIGARHFSQKAQELQNLVGVLNSAVGQAIAPHVSGVQLSKFIEDVMDIRGYNIFRPNVAVMEQQETQALAGQAAENNQMAAEAPTLEQTPGPGPNEQNSN